MANLTYINYTASKGALVYASWKCPYCGQCNYSEGHAAYEKSAATSSLFGKYWKEKAKLEAETLVGQGWKQNVFAFIRYPRENSKFLPVIFKPANTKCSCGKSPKWVMNEKRFRLFFFWIPMVIFTVPFAFLFYKKLELDSSFGGILVAIICALLSAMVAAGIVAGVANFVYNVRIAKIPQEYFPVLGSQNKELVDYAEGLGKRLPTPEETMQIVNREMSLTDLDTPKPPCVCPKCGAEVPNWSDTCQECGAEIKRQG